MKHTISTILLLVVLFFTGTNAFTQPGGGGPGGGGDPDVPIGGIELLLLGGLALGGIKKLIDKKDKP